MQVRSTLAAAALVLAGQVVAGVPPASEPTRGSFYQNFPKDPLVVLAISVEDPLATWNGLLSVVGRVGDAEARQRVVATLDELSQLAGMPLESELLAQLGPELALAIDLPPIDFATIALQAGQPGAGASVLGQIGLVAEVRDADRLDRALRALLAFGGTAPVPEADGMVISRLPVSIKESGDAEATGVMAEMAVHYLIRDGRIAIGFTRAWVTGAFETGPAETKLLAGEDFSRVFGQLDRDAVQLTYVNLPKVRRLVADSEIVTAVLESNPKTAELVRLLAAQDVMEVGLGSTSVPVAGGVRTTNFGPQWLAAPVLSSGLVAALAVPALMLSDAGPTDGTATLEDMREIALACEGFSGDTRRYPRSQGWVPVDRIALYLEPVYATSLPRVDEWENPILYWSDGANYRLLSTGQDGQMDRDWSGAIEPADAAVATGDIVFGDGRVLVQPASLGRTGG